MKPGLGPSLPIAKLRPPPQLVEAVTMGGMAELRGLYSVGECHALVTRDSMAGRRWWHLSVSHAYRYPTWDEIAQARYALLPDALTFAILLPPRDEYVNLHENCFHVHEIDTSDTGRPPAGIVVPRDFTR